MRYFDLRRTIVGGACGIILCCTATAFAQTSQTDVEASLDALGSWLSQSPNGPGWNSYLKTEQLRKQLDKGEQADIEVLRQQVELYSGANPGLRKQHFVDVREALEAWIDELQLPARDELPEVAKATAEQLTPPDPQRLEDAREQLERETEALGRFLARGGPTKEAGWKRFLRWEDLTAELEQETPHYETLVQSWAIFAGDAAGLKHPRFVRYRETLRVYLEVAEYFEDEGDRPLSSLAERLSSYIKDSNEQTAAQLGESLAWLQRTEQAEELVQAMHKHFGQPNLVVDFSERLVVFGFEGEIDESDPIRNYSGGNSTSGTARTIATITAALKPTGARGEVSVAMDGTIRSTTETYNNNGVTFNTKGVTTVDAEKPVFFTSEGLQSEPAEARCTTDNTTYNIRANSAQIENIARQRIAQNERSSEYRSARRAEERVEANLNDRVGKQVNDANVRLQDQFFDPLARRGVEPRAIKFHSTNDRLFHRMILAAPEHLAADNEPPEVKVGGDVVARIHASWINNLADVALRGSLLTDVALAETLEEWRGSVPEELQITEDSEPWDITLESRRPLHVELAKDHITVTLRGTRFTARDRVMQEPMHISAKYRVNRRDGRISLVRDGDVEVTFPEQGEKLSVRFVTMRRFWQTKFSALFGEKFEELDLQLRGAWEDAGPLKLTALGTRPNGWIGLAWEMPAQEERDAADETEAAADE